MSHTKPLPEQALLAARSFIQNGIALGHINTEMAGCQADVAEALLLIERAIEAYDLGARSTAAQPADAGPWSLTEAGSLQSADFTHDVQLGISGDFTNKDERLAYARGLCAKLNAAAAQPVEPTVTPTEAVVGFASWVTCRPGTLPAGEGHDAAPWSEAVHEFVVAQGWPTVRDVFPHNLKRPPLSAPPAASGEPIISIKRSERESLSPEALALLTTTVRDVHLGGPDSVGAQAAAENRRKLWRREVDASRAAASGDSTPPSLEVHMDREHGGLAFGKGDPSGALRPEPEAVGQGRWWRKKPVVIEAFQWNGLESGCQAAKARFPELETSSKSGHLRRPEVTSWHIRTLEGHMRVSPGDWIVRGVAGEFYPCKPDIFAATYEPAEPPQAASGERGD